MTNVTTNLRHDDLIRLNDWRRPDYAMVGTTTAVFYTKRNRPVPEGYRPEAFATFAGNCITSDAGYYAAEDAKYAAAKTVTDGEIVTIEGRQFRVAVNPGNADRPRNSDPIRFDPID